MAISETIQGTCITWGVDALTGKGLAD